MLVLYYFYLEISARKTAKELNLDYQTIQSRFMQFRKFIAEYCNQEGNKLNGELRLMNLILVEREKDKEEEEQKIRQ